MKKSFLVFGCLIASHCGFECNPQGQQASPYKYDKKRDQEIDNLTKFDLIDLAEFIAAREHCPVPSPKKKTPPVKDRKVFFPQDIDTDDENENIGAFVLGCPVPSPKKK